MGSFFAVSNSTSYQVGSRVQFEGDRNAIVMTSGGADSVPVLYYVAKILRPKHVLAIHADYGQRMMEMERLGVTRNVENLKRQGFNVEFKAVDITWLGQLSTSKLVRSEALPETPQDSLQNPDAAAERILWWWDVVRNLQLTTIGLAHAESLDLRSYLTTRHRKIYDVYLGIRRETPVAMKDNCISGDSEVFALDEGVLRVFQIRNLVDPYFATDEEGFRPVKDLKV